MSITERGLSPNVVSVGDVIRSGAYLYRVVAVQRNGEERPFYEFVGEAE